MKKTLIVLMLLNFTSCVCFETEYFIEYEIENNTNEEIVINFEYGTNLYLDSIIIEANSKTNFQESGHGKRSNLDCSEEFYESNITIRVSNNFELKKNISNQDNWEHETKPKRCSSYDKCIFTISNEDLVKK